MKKLFGYIRVSTARQGEGVSLQEQRDAILQYASKTGHQIVRWFEEKQTASKSGRPIFSQMVQLLRRRAADGVVIHKIDRSARNLRDWAELGELIDAEIGVHFANEPLDLRSRGGRLSADILAVVAADFIRNNQEEARKGFYGRLKQGLYPRRAPVGYIDNGRGKPKTIDPVRGPLIRLAFEKYATGNHSIRTLVAEMRRLGLTNRGGKPLSPSALSLVLNNPFYAGIIRIITTQETFTGIHEPLVSPLLFRSVKELLSGKAPARRTVHGHLFSRRFTCSTCGRSLVASKVKGHVYYRCYFSSCVSVREEQIAKAVLQILRTFTLPDQIVDAIIDRIGIRMNDADALAEERRRCIDQSSDLIDRRLARLSDLYLDGAVEQAEYTEKRRDLLERRKMFQEERANIPDAISNELQALRHTFELAKSPDLLFENGETLGRRILLDAVTCNRLVSAENVAISLAPPFDRLADAAKSSFSAPFRDNLLTLDPLIDYFLECLRKEEVHVRINRLLKYLATPRKPKPASLAELAKLIPPSREDLAA
jgi:site-specific DNA recombinase